MKKLFILLFFWALMTQAQQPIKLSLAQSNTLNSVTLAANQSFEFTDTDRTIKITFIPATGFPISLDNNQVKSLLQAERSFTLADFKVPNPEKTQIPSNTTKIQIEVQGTAAAPQAAALQADAPKTSYTASGYIITDALKLAEFIKADDKPNIKVILDNYSITKAEVEVDSFLKSFSSVLAAADLPNQKALINTPANANTFQSGFLNPTAVADALGTFIAKRFKEEINIAFLAKFQKFLKDEAAYRPILPQTYDVLRNKEPYQYTVYFQALHEAFDEDLQNLPNNGLTFLEGFDPAKIKIKDDKVFYSSLAILRAVEQASSKNEVVALTGLENSVSVAKLDKGEPIRNVLKFTGLLAKSLQVSDDQFVRKAELEKYLNNQDAIKCFLGLLRQTQADSLKKIYIDKTTLHDKISEVEKDKIFEQMIKIVGQIEKARNEFTSRSVASNIQAERAQLALKQVKFSLQILDILNVAVELGVKFKLVKPGAAILKYEGITKRGVEITKNVLEKDYSLAFNGFYNLLEDNFNIDNDAMKALLKYGLFAANVAEAETSAEMLQALETAALPVGSYRIKRNNHFNVSINSFGGIGVGYEEFKAKGGTFLAPSAPVGLYFGWGTNQNNVKKGDGHSFGALISLLDVGSVFALRISGDSTSLPEISWKNIFTPGFYLLWGVGKTPLSIGAGVQKAPELQFSSVDSRVSVIDRNAWRIGVKLTVDIPIFNIYTKANSKKFKY
jgi:hypothetical protein